MSLLGHSPPAALDHIGQQQDDPCDDQGPQADCAASQQWIEGNQCENDTKN